MPQRKTPVRCGQRRIDAQRHQQRRRERHEQQRHQAGAEREPDALARVARDGLAVARAEVMRDDRRDRLHHAHQADEHGDPQRDAESDDGLLERAGVSRHHGVEQSHHDLRDLRQHDRHAQGEQGAGFLAEGRGRGRSRHGEASGDGLEPSPEAAFGAAQFTTRSRARRVPHGFVAGAEYLQQPVELPIKSKWPPMTAAHVPRTVNSGTPVAAHDGARAHAMSKGKILVVDDDRLVLATVTHGLAKAGYEIIDADNGDDAILLARQHRPDLALLDIRMEGMSGFDVAAYLRESLQTPFMFLSAFADDDTVAQVKALGAVAYLVKPLDISQIVPTVEAALVTARARKASAPTPAPAPHVAPEHIRPDPFAPTPPPRASARCTSRRRRRSPRPTTRPIRWPTPWPSRWAC